MLPYCHCREKKGLLQCLLVAIKYFLQEAILSVDLCRSHFALQNVLALNPISISNKFPDLLKQPAFCQVPSVTWVHIKD